MLHILLLSWAFEFLEKQNRVFLRIQGDVKRRPHYGRNRRVLKPEKELRNNRSKHNRFTIRSHSETKSCTALTTSLKVQVECLKSAVLIPFPATHRSILARCQEGYRNALFALSRFWNPKTLWPCTLYSDSVTCVIQSWRHNSGAATAKRRNHLTKFLHFPRWDTLHC